MFLLLINDLVLHSKLSKHLFADDTTLQLSGKTIEETERAVNIELEIISKWFKDNRLSVHEGKTKVGYAILPRKKG